MLIAIDYDKTYTLDPELWDIFIKSAESRGHSFVCVTMRHEHEGEDIINSIGKLVKDIIFTGRKAKHPYMDSIDKIPDIWIDDCPYWILNDSF